MTQFRLSRRAFVERLGLGGAAAAMSQFATGRGSESLAAFQPAVARPTAIHLDTNENPNGPGMKALDAMRAALPLANRYPYVEQDALTAALARLHGVKTSEVILGCGSAEVLRMAIQAFASRTRPLVTAAPTYELPSRHAASFGVPIQAVRVEAALGINVSAMQLAAERAGLVYVCNPNNPTGTILSGSTVKAFVERVGKVSPRTVILIDEAYHEYVEEPGYQTSIPLAVSRRNVIVSRTFSKLHGMAGLRCGYGVGHEDTIRALVRFKLETGVNQLAIAAARAVLEDGGRIERERTINRQTREAARGLFESLGYPAAPSTANFFLVDLHRDAGLFRDACERAGVFVGRPFPPLTSYVRISVGTMDEMRRAGQVFKQILGV